MKRVLFVFISLICLLFIESDNIKSYLQNTIEQKYGCSISNIEFFLPNKVCIELIKSDNITLSGVWLRFNAAGCSFCSIEHAEFLEGTDKGLPGNLVFNEKVSLIKDLVNVVSDNIQKYKSFVPKKILISEFKFSDYIVKNIYLCRTGPMIDLEAVIDTIRDVKDFHIKATYNLKNSRVMTDLSFLLFNKHGGFYAESLLNKDNTLSVDKCQVGLDGAQYDLKGILNFNNLSAKIFYKDFQILATAEGDEVNWLVKNKDVTLDCSTNMETFFSVFTVNHGDEKLEGVFQSRALTGQSEKFYGIKNIRFSVQDNEIRCSSKIGKGNISAFGNYKVTDGQLNIVLNQAEFVSDFGVGSISGGTCFNISKEGIFYESRGITFKSKQVDLTLGGQYKFGDLSGYINIRNLDADILGKYTGHISFKNVKNSENILLNGKLFNDFSTIDINSGIKGTDVSLKVNKVNDIQIHLPLFIYANNKLYRFSLDGVTIKSKLNDYLEKFFDERHISGHLVSDLSANIMNNKVNLSGKLTLENGLITFYRHGVIFKDFNVLMTGEGDKLNISEGSLHDVFGGIAKLIGTIVFSKEAISPNIRMEFEKFCLSDDGALHLVGTGGISVLGDLLRRINIIGQIDCAGSSFRMLGYQNDYQDVEVVHIYKYNVVNENKKPLVHFGFSVKLHCPDLVIAADILDTRWAGDLELCGEDKVTFVGDLLAKTGTLRLFKKDFKVSVGTLKFLREYPFNPILFLSSTRNLSDLMVEVKISKTIGKSDFSITSVPEKNIEDIFARLLFDKNADEMSPTDWAQVGYILQRSKRGNVFHVLDQTMSKIGLTDIRLNKDKDSEKSTISVSGKVNDKVSVSVENDIDDKSTYLKIRTDLTDKIAVEVSSAGDVGVSYKRRY